MLAFAVLSYGVLFKKAKGEFIPVPKRHAIKPCERRGYSIRCIFFSGIELPVSTEQEAGWASELVWMRIVSEQ
jgi:hypothetical protein